MRSGFTMAACVLAVLELLGPTSTAEAGENRGSARRATVRVLLPPGARWTVNGKATENPKNRRFVTPPLEKGKAYTYTFAAKFTRGQKSITVRRKVSLRAGQKTVVSLRRSRKYGRSTRATNARSNRGRSYSYRLSVNHPYDPAFGTYSYSDMKVYTPGGDRP
jgi:uncharacterized protein (TIGR03000 family)